ncbi:MAG: ArsR family transcriptional regulator [Trueperaceae bacterium]|nr:ArsR family transcriptional regulator [Trueperaceae bacterium]
MGIYAMSLDAHLEVLADPARLKILDLSQPTVSHHLKQLVLAGFVRAERRGRWTYYELEPARFREIAAALVAFAEVAERVAAVPGAAPGTTP